MEIKIKKLKENKITQYSYIKHSILKKGFRNMPSEIGVKR